MTLPLSSEFIIGANAPEPDAVDGDCNALGRKLWRIGIDIDASRRSTRP